MVESSDSIEAGRPTGRVGNAANSTEPHLHIHSENERTRVRIRINGRFLVRNRLA